MEERIQKILSKAGFGSRRACEQLILSGRVFVNQSIAILGNKANPDVDRILVDGKEIPRIGPFVYIALNKPRGVLSTVESDDGRTTVIDLIPVSTKIYPVGRLDYDSEGLIILTNDGELTNQLTHPRYKHEKEYRVLVNRHPDEDQLNKWRRGIVLEDGFHTSPATVIIENQIGKKTWLKVVISEGHKRQIRETCKILGLIVERIIRIRIHTLSIGKLKPNDWRFLTSGEVHALKTSANSKRISYRQ